MNAAVRDVRQFKQQLIVSPGQLAPARLAAIVLAIAAFFTVTAPLHAETPFAAAMFGLMLVASTTLLTLRRRALIVRSHRMILPGPPGEVRGGARNPR